MKGKKGSQLLTNELMTTVIVVVGIALAVTFVIGLSNRASAATQDGLCRASVLIRGEATVTVVKNLVEFEKFTPLACNTQEAGRLKGDREEIKKIIADLSAKCWWKFAEGSVKDLFKIDRKEKSCFICATFIIEKEMGTGKESLIKIMEEPTLDQRKKDNISSQEIINFMVSEEYNPALIYGGRTNNYYGRDYDYEIPIDVEEFPREVKVRKLKSAPITGYVMDYSFYINEKTMTAINTKAAELQQADSANLLVVAGETFDSFENSDARRIIEGTRLNSNTTKQDALLVLVDFQNHKIKIYAGSELSLFMKDYDIQDILDEEFKKAQTEAKNCQTKVCKLDAINGALERTVNDMTEKLINGKEKLPGINPKSYYYYLSNGGETWAMLSDIETDKTYAITYVSTSDENKWKWAGTATKIGAGVLGAAGALAGLALIATGVGAPIGITLTTVATTAFTGGTLGVLAGTDTATKAGFNDKQVRPNNILIVPVNSIGDACTFTE